MRATLPVISAIGVFAALASSKVYAQCSFDAPTLAKSEKVVYVRAYSSCPGITFPSTNTTTMAGVPGCAPTTPQSPDFFFDNVKSGCSVKVKAKFEDPCSDNTGIPCANFSGTLKCSGIRKTVGGELDNSPGWNLNTVTRATFDDNSNGDMTVIDFPAQFPLPPAQDGGLSHKFNSNDLLNELFGPGSALPGCSTLQILDSYVADPMGNTFAKKGLAVLPY